MLYERIKQIRKSLHLSQQAFGKKLGVSRDVIANIEYDRVKPQKIFIKHLCATLSVSEKWLTDGEGEMFTEDNKDLAQAIEIFESLDPNLQHYALQQVKSLLELQKRRVKKS
jgi:transcriptional regulator with XRE-family HTH domain